MEPKTLTDLKHGSEVITSNFEQCLMDKDLFAFDDEGEVRRLLIIEGQSSGLRDKDDGN